MATTLLGVDVGASLIKASFVDDRAQPIASVERSLPIHIPSAGVAEQDPQGLIRLLADMLRELTEREPERARSIVAIGVSDLGADVLKPGEVYAVRPPSATALPRVHQSGQHLSLVSHSAYGRIFGRP